MRRHDLDVFSLVAGLVFLTVAVGTVLDTALDLSLDGRWVWPLVLIGLGVAGLAGVLRGRGADGPSSEERAAPDQPSGADVG